MTKKLLVFALSALTLASCSSDDDLVGNWVRQSDFDGMPRSNAATFVIDGKGYLATGYDGEDYYNDLWEYNPTTNNWTQKADMPAEAGKRSSAVAFATSTKGYLGTGYDGTNKLKDFWQYDPIANTWTQKTDFPGTGRYSAVGFAIGDYGYLGTGYDGNEMKDFYMYNESNNSWTAINSLGGAKRRNASVFIISGTAYVGFGSNNGIYETDFWSFTPSSSNPEATLWVRKKDLDEDNSKVARSSAAAFTVNGKGYISTGYSSGVVATTFEYDPNNDRWSQKRDFEGVARQNASSFSINGRGYVIAGNSGATYFDDMRELYPNAAYDDKD